MILQALMEYYENLAKQEKLPRQDGVRQKFPMESICLKMET